VTFLGHVDPIGMDFRVFAPDVSVFQLAGQIRDFDRDIRPGLIITHGSGGEYWHPAHLLTHAATLRAAGGAVAPRISVLTIRAWRPDAALPGLMNRDDPADLVFDGKPHRERRIAALRAHRSQVGYFSGQGGGSIEDFLDRIVEESYRVYPASGINAPDRQAASNSRIAACHG
jgi:N-acetylglucosamine malate deacetylase 2